MIPQVLRDKDFWCVWKREIRGGKPTKVPYNPMTGGRAETNNPDTFGSFDLADERYMTEDYDGVGIRLSYGISAVDIDHCVNDGVIDERAMDIIDRLKSYTEFSPSKTGIRIIFEAPNLVYDAEKYYLKNPNNGVEIYVCGATNRFVTMTGNTAYDYPVRDVTDDLQAVLDAYMVRPKKRGSSASQTAPIRTELSDDEIIDKASRDDKFRALFVDGDLTEYKNDHSGADLALCNKLAFWTGCDEEQMDRLFRRSALFRESKWNRQDYSHNTMQEAIRTCADVYNPGAPSTNKTIFERMKLPQGKLGDNWELSYSGIKHLVPGKNNAPAVWETVTHTPVFPSAYLENTTEGIHKVELRFLANGRLNTIICDRETVANKSKIVSLANSGIGVTSLNANTLIQYFTHVEAVNGGTIPRYESVSHVGWIGDDFLPYNSEIKFDGEAENKPLYSAIAQHGDLDRWVEFTHNLRSNLYLRLMMAASFASPLIERCNALPFVFHLWGSTGKGKTVALMVAMSIWGDPSAGKLTRTMNMTNASMMSAASFLKNIPFAGDELQTIKNKDMKYDDLIMQVTEGIERGRLDRNAKLRPTRSWRNAFLFTGEERCTSDFSGGGAQNRVIEVEAEGEIIANGNKTVDFIGNNYGYAGRKFIEYVSDKNISAAYSEVFPRVLDACNTTAKQAMAITLMLIADKLACECLYHKETPLTIQQITKFLKTGEEVNVAERAYSFISDWVVANNYKLSGTADREIWGKRDGDKVLVIHTYLKKALADQGFSFDAVKKAWAERGYIEKNENGFLMRTRINGDLVYCVSIFMPNKENLDKI